MYDKEKYKNRTEAEKKRLREYQKQLYRSKHEQRQFDCTEERACPQCHIKSHNFSKTGRICRDCLTKNKELREIEKITGQVKEPEKKYQRRTDTIKKPINTQILKVPEPEKRDIFARTDKNVSHGWNKKMEEIKQRINQFYGTI